MNGSEVETFEGRFWLPQDRHRSYGRVDYDHEHGVRLHLVDTNLTEWTSNGPRGPGPVDVLHGETLGGTPLTLLGLYPTRWSMEGLGPTAGDVVDAVAERLLRGAHVNSAEDVLATGATFGLHGLKEFPPEGRSIAGRYFRRLIGMHRRTPSRYP